MHWLVSILCGKLVITNGCLFLCNCSLCSWQDGRGLRYPDKETQTKPPHTVGNRCFWEQSMSGADLHPMRKIEREKTVCTSATTPSLQAHNCVHHWATHTATHSHTLTLSQDHDSQSYWFSGLIRKQSSVCMSVYVYHSKSISLKWWIDCKMQNGKNILLFWDVNLNW